jgi:putative ABC transport system permease protein
MRNLFSMFSIVAKRLLHSTGLSISALAGIICVLTLAICIPVFAYAVSGGLLRDQLAEQSAKSGHPLFSIRMYYLFDTRAPLDTQKTKQLTEHLPALTTALVGIQPVQVVTEVNSPPVNLIPDPDHDLPEWSQLENLTQRHKFVDLEGLTEHAEIVEGEWPQSSATGPIQVAIHNEMANSSFFNLGDQYKLSNNVEIEISAIWQEIDPRDPFWYNLPANHFRDLMWVPSETFHDRISPMLEKPIRYVSWYMIMDEADIKFQRARQYSNGMLRLDTELRNMGIPIKMDYSPLESLMTYQNRVKSLTILLYAVGAPLVVLALIFIGLTSIIVVQEYSQEIAMLRSRGTSRVEILLMNISETLVLLLIALPVSLFLGWLASNLMGQTESFLQFTQRPILPFSYEGVNLPALILAVGLIILARLLPALSISQRTIINLKQEQSRSETRPVWQRFYLDLVLLVISGYTYLSLRGWEAVAALVVQIIDKDQKLGSPQEVMLQFQRPVEPYRDPLMFIAPALFVIACSMIFMRIIPFSARMLTAIFGRLPGAWHYLSLQQISRRPQDYSSAVLLIMISLSLAIFSATTAKTLDQWLRDSIKYEAGADLVVWEYPPEANAGPSQAGIPQTSQFADPAYKSVVSSGLTLADLGGDSEWAYMLQQHRNLPGVEDATRVGRYKSAFSSGFGEIPAEVMGIDRLEFPMVAFFRQDFADESLGGLMNLLGADPRALLIPRTLALSRNLEIGDQVAMKITIFDQTLMRDFIIAGVYDYFPTVNPRSDPVVIANLDYIFGSPDAIIDYETWLSLQDDAEPKDILLTIFKTMNLIAAVRNDAVTKIREEQAGIERVGLFGVLNVGFLTAGLMPAIGFILYSYASLRRRFIQLGILQALGLSARQLTGYLISEQLLLMGFAILGGALVGLSASHIFVPFLQSGSHPVPPFQVFSGLLEATWLSIGFAVVLGLTMILTIIYLTRLKVFQAIKLGETI